MVLIPGTVIRQAYARIGAFSGEAADITTAYTGSLAALNTESFPLQAMYDLLLTVENELATAVASNQDNVLRSTLQDIATVTSGSRIPAVGDSGGKIIGVWGQVRQASTGIELTPGLHEDEIRAVVNGPAGLFKSTLYSYALRPPRIYATVGSLEIDVCAFDFAARQTAINADGALLFQACEGAYFSGLMSGLKNEDAAYTALSNEFAPQYTQWLQAQQGPRPVVTEAAA